MPRYVMPKSIMMVCWSGFRLYLGRGAGADLLYGQYLTSIVESVGRVGIFAWIVSICKWCATIPMGYLGNHIAARHLVIIWKIWYIITAIGYVIAWVTHSWLILLMTMIINGVATALTLTTYQIIIRDHARAWTDGYAYGRYVWSINIGYAVGWCIAYMMIDLIPIERVFVAVALGASVWMIPDAYLPVGIRVDRSQSHPQGFLQISKKLTQSIRSSIHTIRHIITSRTWVRILVFQSLFSLLDYVILIFIPIMMIQSGYKLTDIVIAFIIMKIPYILSSTMGNLSDRYFAAEYLTVWLLSLIGLSFVGLGMANTLVFIRVIIAGMSISLAMLRPIILWWLWDIRWIGASAMTSIQEFVSRSGEIVGSLIMGVCASFIWIQWTLISIGWVVILLICRYALSEMTKKSSIISYNPN